MSSFSLNFKTKFLKKNSFSLCVSLSFYDRLNEKKTWCNGAHKKQPVFCIYGMHSIIIIYNKSPSLAHTLSSMFSINFSFPTFNGHTFDSVLHNITSTIIKWSETYFLDYEDIHSFCFGFVMIISLVCFKIIKREFLILKIELTANVEHRDSVLIVHKTAPAVGKIKEICFPFVCLPKQQRLIVLYEYINCVSKCIES